MTQKHVVLTAAMIGFPVLLLVYQITKTRSDLKSCQSKSAYIEALVRHASPDHYIVLALVDAAFVDMAINLYEMSFRPNAVDNFLFVGVGQRVCEIMNASSAGLPCYLYRCTPTMWRPTSPAARLHEHGLHPEDEHPHGHDRRSTERRLYCPTHRLGHRLLPQSTSASPHMHDKYLIYFELHVSLIWFAQQKVQKVLRLQLHDTKVHDMQFRKKNKIHSYVVSVIWVCMFVPRRFRFLLMIVWLLNWSSLQLFEDCIYCRSAEKICTLWSCYYDGIVFCLFPRWIVFEWLDRTYQQGFFFVKHVFRLSLLFEVFFLHRKSRSAPVSTLLSSFLGQLSPDTAELSCPGFPQEVPLFQCERC